MSEPQVNHAITAALENGARLMDDARLMMDFDRFPSALSLAVLAQEEYAKALLLSLVSAKAIPWSSDVRRALHDHICKQLVSVILDFLSPNIEEFILRHNPSTIGLRRLPTEVLDAIHIICHERIPASVIGGG